MNMDTTNKMCVVKKYHTLINKEAWYADLVRVGFLHLRSIFSLDFERKLNTGCGKTFLLVFPNRQVADLPILQWRAYKRSEYVSHSISWGFVQGGSTPFMFISPLGEKKLTN